MLLTSDFLNGVCLIFGVFLGRPLTMCKIQAISRKMISHKTKEQIIEQQNVRPGLIQQGIGRMNRELKK